VNYTYPNLPPRFEQNFWKEFNKAMKTMRQTNPKYKHGPEERLGLLEMLNWLKERYPLKRWTLVEVGTYLGESAEIFSSFFKKVITCDPWIPAFMQTYAEGKEKVTITSLMKILQSRLEDCRNVEFYRLPGSLLAHGMKDQSIDMVYIDAWHRVIPCTADLLTWLPKVKPGGIISGHDYRTFDYTETIPAVRYVFGEPFKVFSDSSWIVPVPDRRRKIERKEK